MPTLLPIFSLWPRRLNMARAHFSIARLWSFVSPCGLSAPSNSSRTPPSRRRRAAECGQQFPPSDGDCHTPLPCEVRKGRIPRHERAVSRRVGWLALLGSGAARHFPAAATSPPPAISDDSATAAATDISSAIVPRLYFRARSRGRAGGDLESPRPRRFGYGAEGADGRKTLRHRPGW